MTVSPSAHVTDHSEGFSSIEPTLCDESHPAKATSPHPWLVPFAGTCLPSGVMGRKPANLSSAVQMLGSQREEEGVFRLPRTLGFLHMHVICDKLCLCISRNRQQLILGPHISSTSNSWRQFSASGQCNAFQDSYMPGLCSAPVLLAWLCLSWNSSGVGYIERKHVI